MKENRPIISVLLPAYNAGKFVGEAITSILNQTFRNFELIIINDGSTDNTESVIKSFHDDRIRYYKNEHNIKLIKTLNRGLSLARGVYISRMDSDDIALSTMLEEQYYFAINHPDVDIINIRTYEMSNDGHRVRRFPRTPLLNSESLKYVLLFQNVITHPGVMLKAEKVKAYQYRDIPSVANFEDLDLWLRMINDGCCCETLDSYLLFYRINESGVTRTLGVDKRNRLRQSYTISIFHDIYGLDVPREKICFLFGSCCSFSTPFDTNRFIKRVVLSLITDSDTLRLFKSWYHYRFIISGLQMLKTTTFGNKMGILLFILSHPLYIFDSYTMRYLFQRIFNPWKVRK